MTDFRRFLLVILLALLYAIPIQTARAQSSVTLTVQPGFDGFYKLNHWTPIRVTATNQGAGIDGELRLLDNNTPFNTPTILYRYPIELPPQSRKEITMYVPLRGQLRVQVELVDQADTLLTAKQATARPISGATPLIGVVASDGSLFNHLARADEANQTVAVGVAHLTLADLPTPLQAWRGLDYLVFNDIDSGPLTAEQQQALRSWVSQGGRLVVGGGPNATQTLAGLQPILALESIRIETVAHPLNTLDEMAQLPLENRGPYVAAVPDLFFGEVMAQENNIPLIIRQPLGFGEITYMAFDFTLAPLDELMKTPFFMRAILGDLSPLPTTISSHLNFGQLQTSLSVLSNQDLTEPYWICLFMLLYVIIVGPLNFVVLRLLKRSEWAWVTIPLIICCFSAAIYSGGYRLRGSQPMLSELTLVEAASGTDQAQATSYVGVYSPSRANYALNSPSSVFVEGLPDSLGVTNQFNVITDGSTRITDLRADIGGQPGVIVHQVEAAPNVTAELTYQPFSKKISGSLMNHSQKTLQNSSLIILTNRAEEEYYLSIYLAHATELDNLTPGSRLIDTTLSEKQTYGTFYTEASQSDDAILVSRDMVMRALFFSDSYQVDLQRPVQHLAAYLVGWGDNHDSAVTLASHSHDQIQQTLFIINLPLTVE